MAGTLGEGNVATKGAARPGQHAGAVADPALRRGSGTCVEPDALTSPMVRAACCKPSRAEPSRAEPSRAEPSRAEPSRAEPSRAEPSRAEPSRAEPSRAEPSRAEPSRAMTAPRARRRGHPWPDQQLFPPRPLRTSAPRLSRHRTLGGENAGRRARGTPSAHRVSPFADETRERRPSLGFLQTALPFAPDAQAGISPAGRVSRRRNPTSRLELAKLHVGLRFADPTCRSVRGRRASRPRRAESAPFPKDTRTPRTAVLPDTARSRDPSFVRSQESPWLRTEVMGVAGVRVFPSAKCVRGNLSTITTEVLQQ